MKATVNIWILWFMVHETKTHRVVPSLMSNHLTLLTSALAVSWRDEAYADHHEFREHGLYYRAIHRVAKSPYQLRPLRRSKDDTTKWNLASLTKYGSFVYLGVISSNDVIIDITAIHYEWNQIPPCGAALRLKGGSNQVHKFKKACFTV